jgi:hypothetical protein
MRRGRRTASTTGSFTSGQSGRPSGGFSIRIALRVLPLRLQPDPYKSHSIVFPASSRGCFTDFCELRQRRGDHEAAMLRVLTTCLFRCALGRVDGGRRASLHNGDSPPVQTHVSTYGSTVFIPSNASFLSVCIPLQVSLLWRCLTHHSVSRSTSWCQATQSGVGVKIDYDTSWTIEYTRGEGEAAWGGGGI